MTIPQFNGTYKAYEDEATCKVKDGILTMFPAGNHSYSHPHTIVYQKGCTTVIGDMIAESLYVEQVGPEFYMVAAKLRLKTDRPIDLFEYEDPVRQAATKSWFLNTKSYAEVNRLAVATVHQLGVDNAELDIDWKDISTRAVAAKK
jgi:hypothetical protein